MDLSLIEKLKSSAQSKIVLLIMDGLGGLPQTPGGKTELETAETPHLDQLATEGLTGLHQPVRAGITAGSGPAHLAVLGYDPVQYQVGRGVLSALGIDFELRAKDVAARGNFCTIDNEGKVIDRRAGRISTEKNKELCAMLRSINIPGVEFFIKTVKEHRFLLVFRGTGLGSNVQDTDPQKTGEKSLVPRPRDKEAEKTAGVIQQFIDSCEKLLKDQEQANMVLLRGFSSLPDWPQFPETYGVRAAALAAYPMYRGVAKLVGMNALGTYSTFAEELDGLEKHWHEFDFFFIHFKKTDSAGEDGDFLRKVQLIEQVDAVLPRITALNPDVLVVTGDHSTPAVLKSHSWHPVPALIWSKYCRADKVTSFGERACMDGGLGTAFPAVELMPIAFANAGRLAKFGA